MYRKEQKLPELPKDIRFSKGNGYHKYKAEFTDPSNGKNALSNSDIETTNNIKIRYQMQRVVNFGLTKTTKTRNEEPVTRLGMRP